MGETSRLRYGAIVMAAAAMTLGSGCAAILGAEEPEAVVIGVDLEETGDGSALGNVYLNAIELRAEQVNQQGLLRGDRQLELRVLDNRSDESTASGNLAELADDPAVTAIISGSCGTCVIDAAADFDSQDIAVLSLASDSGIAQPVEERQSVFKLAPNADHNAARLVRELEEEEVESIGIVATSDPYGDAGLQEMTDAAERADIEVGVSVQLPDETEESLASAAADIVAFTPEDTELSPTLQPTTEEQAGPDAVVMWAPGPVVGDLAVALREAEYEGSFYLDAMAADDLFLAEPHATALEGAVMVFFETLVIDEVIAVSPAKAARQNWFRSYTAREGTYHGHSSFAADAVNVIVDAINRFETIERDRVRFALENTLLDGLTGPIRITTENHSGISPQGLNTVVARGDRWRLVG